MKYISFRHITCTLLCMVVLSLYGQENFEDHLNAIGNMTPYQAVYQLEQYQATHPKFAGVYYHLGKANEEMIATIHPIIDYELLKRTIYNTKLYYGNCMHYAQNSSLKNEYFVGIPTKGKRIEYEDIVHFVRKKLNKNKETERLVDNLYTTYFAMVQRYGECRHLFTKFCEHYPSEKQAHLRLKAEDITLLETLKEQFDSLKLDISAFERALEAYPIEDYKLNIVYNDIRLYRLDGLSHTPFLTSPIPLWDYGSYAEQFLKRQNSEYAQYYQTIEKEYQQINEAIHQARKGNKQPIKSNNILTNYINKMDYESFMLPLTKIQQQCADMINCYANGLFDMNDSIPEQIEQVLSTLYAKHLVLQENQQLIVLLKERMSMTELDKYKQVLSMSAGTTPEHIERFAQERTYIADSMYNELCKQFYTTIESRIQPFEKYVDELTDQVITAEQVNIENDTIVTVLPIAGEYLVVYASGRLVVMDANLMITKTFEHSQYTPIKAAYKINGDNYAIVSPSYVYFIDNEGKIK